MSTTRPTVRLASYDNSWYRPGPMWKRAAWYFFGEPLVACGWIPSSTMRVALLRLFGATVGDGTVIKPRVRVKYPWFLQIGRDCWIGEECWIDNLVRVRLGNDVCLSQGAYLCTGNHRWDDPAFGLVVRPIDCQDGSWAGARSVLGPGSTLGRGAVAGLGSVVSGNIPDFEIHAGNPARFVRKRVLTDSPDAEGRTS